LASGNSGLIAENIEEATTIMATENFADKKLDVILFDVPFIKASFTQFCNVVACHDKVQQDTPLIYNREQLADKDLCDCKSLDDVVDLSKWQFDLSAKVEFLRKSKSFRQPAQKGHRIEAKRCMYKRMFDITVSSLLLLLALPLFLLIAIAIRLESRGPIFYNARRAGRGFRIFKFYKFRTMVVNADKKIEQLAHLNQYGEAAKGAQFFKIANDPRITRVGRFLRNTSLDELPQLFNVLKGDMSLVGNRPLPLYEAATLTTNDFVERFMAPAGITGLWQIKKRGKSDMSVEERINLDISYARKSTLLYDLWIMAQTPGALIQKTDV
jgi:lipopolysaccharide/colanic/teichoic acid biosynthesis glycosyltransferase